ncbi:MAG: hypothetical protein U0W40_11805 [Acidimicrobiia bacterium]
MQQLQREHGRAERSAGNSTVKPAAMAMVSTRLAQLSPARFAVCDASVPVVCK